MRTDIWQTRTTGIIWGFNLRRQHSNNLTDGGYFAVSCLWGGWYSDAVWRYLCPISSSVNTYDVSRPLELKLNGASTVWQILSLCSLPLTLHYLCMSKWGAKDDGQIYWATILPISLHFLPQTVKCPQPSGQDGGTQVCSGSTLSLFVRLCASCVCVYTPFCFVVGCCYLHFEAKLVNLVVLVLGSEFWFVNYCLVPSLYLDTWRWPGIRVRSR